MRTNDRAGEVVLRVLAFSALICILFVAGCGGTNAGSGSGTPVTYTVAGAVSGLAGSGLMLQDNGGNNLPVSASGTFMFTAAIASGGAYNVTVLTQPSNPAQTCMVSSGSGTASSNITSVLVSCNTPTLQSIAVTPTNPTIAKTTSEQFAATGTYSDNSTKDVTASATWSSSNTTVASVGSSAGSYGLASALAAGSSTIKASVGSTSGTSTLTVTSATVVSIAVTPATASISVGGTQQYTATGTFSDSSKQDLSTMATWSSSGAGFATISNAAGSNGLATGTAVGSTTISAVFNGITGTASLTVTAVALHSIAVTPANPSVAAGTAEQFTATGTYSDNSTKNLTTTATWSSSTTSIATISNAAGSNGQAATLAAGTTTIAATLVGITGSTTLTVTPATLVSIAVTPATLSVIVGGHQQFTATGTYSDKSTHDITTTVTWASTATSVATVSNATGSNGLATGVALGTTTISATLGSVSSQTTLTVAASVPSTLAIYPGQYIFGLIDQNGGLDSNLTPYLLIATGGNVGPAGYTWTVPTGSVRTAPPAIVIQPNGVVDDVTPTSLTQGTFTLPIQVSDGTTTVTSVATVDLTSVCNSSNGNSNNPCSSSAVTNQHISYLPNGTLGSTYAATIVTSGGTPPYTWALGSGTLPPGIVIDPAKGILKGTPTLAGTYNFYVLTTDAKGASTSSEIGAGVLAAQFTLVVH